jgi:ADP-heptose:LPS heptosyltransferase
LLDVRHHRPPHAHEVTAALDLAVHAGGSLPPGDDGRLAVRRPLPTVARLVPQQPYVVVHPSASVAARALVPDHAARLASAVVDAGWQVVVTGGHGDRVLTRSVADAAGAVDLGGRTTFGELAAVLAGAHAVVVGNTGPAHLSAAVGTPVVSLFSPVVPPERWRPFGVPQVLLGDQREACAGTRARECPVPGHPCLASVSPRLVVDAVRLLAGEPTDGLARHRAFGETLDRPDDVQEVGA